MDKIIMMLGVAAITLGATSQGAEARKITYEINGKRYTYESRNPKQAAIARKRIDAASAADAAKAKADAEKAKTPLAYVFSSPIQKEADEAQARLQEALGEPDQPEAVRKREQPSKATRQSQRRRNQGAEQARQADAPSDKARNVVQKQLEPAADLARLSRTTSEPQAASSGQAKPMVKSVSFDVESGIKTTIMLDGSIQEEPFDSATLSKLAFEQEGSGSLADFVKRLRNSSPVEATGSTSVKADATGASRP